MTTTDLVDPLAIAALERELAGAGLAGRATLDEPFFEEWSATAARDDAAAACMRTVRVYRLGYGAGPGGCGFLVHEYRAAPCTLLRTVMLRDAPRTLRVAAAARILGLVRLLTRSES